MTARYDGPLNWGPVQASLRPARDVAVVRGLARDFRKPVAIPAPPAKGEARLLAGLLVLCLVWAVLAVIGAAALGCWLWPHRIGAEQTAFWLAVFAFVGWVCRFVNVHRRHR